MRDKTDGLDSGEVKVRAGQNPEGPGHEDFERPPESAENFEHVLRRLAALRPSRLDAS